MKQRFLMGTALLVLAMSACKKNADVNNFANRSLHAGPFVDTVDLPLIISADRTLTADTLYLLDDKTWVSGGAKLTINAGVRIEGVKKAAAVDASALIITRGSQIEALGTPENPIVFTSNEASKAPGDWGGVVLLGEAEINPTSGEAEIEGINPPLVPVGIDYRYGGEDNEDNSGIMQYVRIEYAGAIIEEGNELNALTLGGVGRGTTLDHIEAFHGADDGFEFFGGNVNAKYLLSIANNDDQFDFDFGYSGHLQFLVAIIDPAVRYAANNTNGIECDNDGSASGNLPLTKPVISNITIIGAPSCTLNNPPNNPSAGEVLLYGTRFRRNTRLVFRNAVVYGFPTAINLEGSPVYSALTTSKTDFSSTTSQYFDNVVYGCTANYNSGWTADASNTGATATSGLGLNDPFPTVVSDYFDGISQPLAPVAAPATGADFTGLSSLTNGSINATFDAVTYKGGALDASGNYWLADSWISF